jgi:hypothetical protein
MGTPADWPTFESQFPRSRGYFLIHGERAAKDTVAGTSCRWRMVYTIETTVDSHDSSCTWLSGQGPLLARLFKALGTTLSRGLHK